MSNAPQDFYIHISMAGTTVYDQRPADGFYAMLLISARGDVFHYRFDRVKPDMAVAWSKAFMVMRDMDIESTLFELDLLVGSGKDLK